MNREFKICELSSCSQIFYRKYEADQKWLTKRFCSYQCKQKHFLGTRRKNAHITSTKRRDQKEQDILAGVFDKKNYENIMD